MNLQALAVLTVALLALAAAFQIALAVGAPWGAAAYGGRVVPDGVLPGAYRLASGVAAVVLLAAMWVVLASAGILGRGPVTPTTLAVLLWCLAALFALNTLGNARGLHIVERWGAGTLTALLAVFCALIASS